MIRTRENVAATAKRIIAARPVLEPIIKAFEELFDARATLPLTLLPLIEKSKLVLPDLSNKHTANGLSLLSDMSLQGFDSVLSASAETMLPLLKEQEYLAPFIPTLENYFITQKNDAEAKETAKAPYQSYQLAEAYLANNPEVVEKTAEYLQMPSHALLFAFHFILAPSIQALVMHSFPQVIEDDEDELSAEDTPKQKVEAPWNANGQWKEGYCPVCASFPSISYLDRALLDENNQFLASGGGKKNLHCSLCGTNWHFKRGCCPACKEEGPDVMEILKESKTESGERIDWCTKCKSYCPNIDLRVNGKRPDFDMMALGVLHLDMIAAEKKLTPLTPSFWNTFEGE